MGDVCAQPVVIQSALFWVGACKYGPDVLFVHQGNVFLDWPNVVLVSARRTLRRVLALWFMFMCALNDMPQSYVTPSVVAVVV